MSVPAPEREEGQLKVNTEARRMAAYTLHITANPKHFDQAHEYYKSLWEGSTWKSSAES